MIITYIRRIYIFYVVNKNVYLKINLDEIDFYIDEQFLNRNKERI